MTIKLCSKIPCNCILIAMGLSHWHTWCNRWTLAKLPGRSKAEQTAESSLPWPFFLNLGWQFFCSMIYPQFKIVGKYSSKPAAHGFAQVGQVPAKPCKLLLLSCFGLTDKNCCPTSSIRTEIATQEPPNGDADPLLTGFALEQRDDTDPGLGIPRPFQRTLPRHSAAGGSTSQLGAQERSERRGGAVHLSVGCVCVFKRLFEIGGTAKCLCDLLRVSECLPKPWKYPERNRFVEILQLGLPIFDFLKFLMGLVKITPGISWALPGYCIQVWFSMGWDPAGEATEGFQCTDAGNLAQLEHWDDLVDVSSKHWDLYIFIAYL